MREYPPGSCAPCGKINCVYVYYNDISLQTKQWYIHYEIRIGLYTNRLGGLGSLGLLFMFSDSILFESITFRTQELALGEKEATASFFSFADTCIALTRIFHIFAGAMILPAMRVITSNSMVTWSDNSIVLSK